MEGGGKASGEQLGKAVYCCFVIVGTDHLPLIGPEPADVGPPRFCVACHDGEFLLTVLIIRYEGSLYGLSSSSLLLLTTADHGSPTRHLPPTPSHLKYPHISSATTASEEYPQIDETPRQRSLSRRLWWPFSRCVLPSTIHSSELTFNSPLPRSLEQVGFEDPIHFPRFP